MPQGSCLGPFLYIAYANELNNMLPGIDIVTYADDIALCVSGDDLDSLTVKMNEGLEVVFNWSCFNLLPINFEKCHALVITNRTGNDAATLKIGNHTIPIKLTTNYLGIHIDSKLTFSHHLSSVNTRLSQLVGITWKLTYRLNICTAKSLYFSFVYSLISYGIAAWGGVFMTMSCTRTFSLHRRIVMNLFSWHFPGVDFVGICSRLGFLLPTDIYRINLMTFYYNNTRSQHLPPLRFMDSQSSYDFRVTTTLVVPFPRTLVVKSHFSYQIPMVWNSIPETIKNEPFVSKFKVAYKRFLLDSMLIGSVGLR